ncbi:Deoxynucleotidyltransferase terminal-interacting protein 2 [Dinochytrium kinnereticum]|nr:Deoxynucleotidyltransferase terminal-interacting protein 2 [Dinochytrium kinnereticum]
MPAPPLADLDLLLEKAAANLHRRRLQAEEEEEKEREDGKISFDGDNGSEPSNTTTSKRSQKSALGKIRLSAGIPSSSPYLKKSKLRPVTLDKSRIDVVEAKGTGSSSKTSGLDLAVSKGLDRSRPDLVERIVIPRKPEVLPVGLDMTEKDKKKLAKEGETAGAGWFHMKAPDLTDELKRDLQVIRSRAALDPKRHYKKPDKSMKGKLPKFFQIGTVMDSAADFYSARLAKKERKDGILGELMADRETKSYLKKKFTKIQGEKEAKTKAYRRPLATMRGKSKNIAASAAAKKRLRM